MVHIGINWHGIIFTKNYDEKAQSFTRDMLDFNDPADLMQKAVLADNQSFLDCIAAVTPLSFDNYNRKGTSKGHAPVYTYRNLVNLELRSTNHYHYTDTTCLQLERIQINGESFRTFDIDPAATIRHAATYNLLPQRIDLNFDISADHIPYDIVDQHFTHHHLTTRAAYTPWTSPEKARSWYVGNCSKQGYRFIMYEAAKIHPELPEGAWRIELQLMGADAKNFAKSYLSTPTPEFLKSFVLGKLTDRVTFRVAGTDSNKNRMAIPTWWKEIVKGAGNYSEHKKNTKPIKIENQERSLEQRLKKLWDTAGPEMFERCSSRVIPKN